MPGERPPMKKRVIRSSADFRRVMDAGKKFTGKYMTLFIVRNTEDLRIGYAAGRRIGNAVKRNRAKRILREIFRMAWPRLADNMRVVAVAKSAILRNSFARKEKEFMQMVFSGGCTKEDAFAGE